MMIRITTILIMTRGERTNEEIESVYYHCCRSSIGQSFAGCSSQDGSGKDSGKVKDGNVLTVYTARSESLNNAVIPNFEQDTGIKVEVIVAGTGELVKRVESEKNNPVGDILWAADETMLKSKADLFEQYVSPEDKNMIEGFRNKTGYFSPAFADPTVFIVNTNLIGDIKVEGFEDLLNPELKGKSHSVIRRLPALLSSR